MSEPGIFEQLVAELEAKQRAQAGQLDQVDTATLEHARAELAALRGWVARSNAAPAKRSRR